MCDSSYHDYMKTSMVMMSKDHASVNSGSQLQLDVNNKLLEDEKTDSKNDTKVDEDKNLKTTDKGEEDDSENDKKRFECCCNPFDYIDINATKYYDLLIVLSSFANFILGIVLIICFYNKKEWIYFAILVSLHILSHICYAIGFGYLYTYEIETFSDCRGKIEEFCRSVLYSILILFVAPFINLLIYLTSDKNLVLTNLFLQYFENSTKVDQNRVKSWHEAQVYRHFGYIIEFFVNNIPLFVFQISFIYYYVNISDNENYDGDNNNYDLIMFYLLWSFYINLFCIIIKSYLLLYTIPHIAIDEYTTAELFFCWCCIVSDASAAIYLIIWTYVNISLYAYMSCQ